ncbi:MAG: PKD domain-containing protein, partial [Bacteroidota bacterium]
VCVSEYRNGELLGTIQRDFQFNVAACIQEITAQIASDEVIENLGPNGQIVSRDFALTVCGQESVEFVNESFDRAFIDDIRWEFDGGTILSDDWNATVAFPSQGTYAGKLVLNPDSPQCIDSANIFVEILPDLTADFAATFDSCSISPVQFTDNSVAEASTITNWQWAFDDGATSTQMSPTHQYDNSGSYRVQLTIEDDNGCTSEYVETINYAPAPQAVDIDQSATTGCDPVPVIFINNSSPLDDSYEVLWDFGDGNTSNEINPIHTYDAPGTYSVSLSIESPIGCEVEENYPDLITVLASPTAGFSLSSTELSTTNPSVSVIDESLSADSWRYLFGNQGTATVANPNFTFRDTGRQQIVQIITALSGCQDTAVQFLDILPFVEWYMPNAFTPNRDGTNEVFIGNGFLVGATNFNFTIWNRWGEMVFQTSDYTVGWNGRKNNTGRDSPSGVYVYLLSYRTPRGEVRQLEGFATLVR